MLGRGIRWAGRQVRQAWQDLRTWRRWRSMRGDRFECPLCEQGFRELLPTRESYSIRGVMLDHATDNSVCPKCGSNIRHRFIYSFLQQTIRDWPANMRVLHFAPEAALYRYFRRKGVEYVPGDLVPKPKLGVRRLDITNLDLPANHFDLVVCIHVLEHIMADRQAISELYRVLKPGGHALIAVPTYGATTYEDPTLDCAGRVRMFGIGGHMRLNGLDVSEKFEASGFTVQTVSLDQVPGKYFDRTATTPHIDSDRYLFWCRKPLANEKREAA